MHNYKVKREIENSGEGKRQNEKKNKHLIHGYVYLLAKDIQRRKQWTS